MNKYCAWHFIRKYIANTRAASIQQVRVKNKKDFKSVLKNESRVAQQYSVRKQKQKVHTRSGGLVRLPTLQAFQRDQLYKAASDSSSSELLSGNITDI